jgi:hypothetical protein
LGDGSPFAEGKGDLFSRPHTAREPFEKRRRIVVGSYVALDTVQDTAGDRHMENVAGVMERFRVEQPLFWDLVASLQFLLRRDYSVVSDRACHCDMVM